ncbi:hypothetical protein H310_01703 [Aphanomyces invadans]|uniref:Uncharacterized protein n=1 Tax=Aphanomyces invadans TaxID=157072 RepID=A0A024UTR8_9STRA|nr:hypothetical protein H310_01703 [Aphanomyces invadans]ETW09322.1 hypothetical protein H310_01703 [Aphanomyces invadans]|eukprot:XP_008863127.1 hypothetical protein H310_01703 [Aphanomyces invadans]
MSAAESLLVLLAGQDQPAEAKDRRNAVQPLLPLFTRLMHTRVSSEVPTDSRVTLQDLLHDQPDATLGKELAIAFRQITSMESIIQRSTCFDPSIFPDTTNERATLHRIEWTLGTLYVALESRRENNSQRPLPWICGIANHSHVLELQCILNHALSRDWLPLPPLVSLLLETSIGRILLLGIVQNDPSAMTSVVDHILLTMRQNSDMDSFDSTHLILVTIAAMSVPAAHAVRRQCLGGDFAFAAAIALDITNLYLRDTPVFLTSVMQSTKYSTLWAVVGEALTQDPTTPFRAKTSDMLRRLRLDLQEALAAPKSLDLLTVLKAYCGLIGRGSLVVSDVEGALLFRVIGQECQQRRHRRDGPRSSRFVQLAFTTIVLVCLSKLSQPVDAATTQLTKEARQLIGLLYELDAPNSGSLFLMMALLLYTKPGMVIDLLRSVLDSHIVVQADRVPVFGEFVLKLDFTEPVLVHGLLAMPGDATTGSVNATMVAPLREWTLRVAYSLLCERSFVRHKVNPNDWLVQHQIDKASLPIHPILPNLVVELVENHVGAYDMTTQQSSIPPLRHALVLDGIKAVLQTSCPAHDVSNHSITWARATLLLVYALHFNRRHVKDASSRKYDLHAVPIARIYHTAASQSHVGGAFEFVFPVLSRLVLDESPHVLQVQMHAGGAPSEIGVILRPSHVTLQQMYGQLKQQKELAPSDMPAVRDLLCDLELVPVDQVVPWLDWLARSALPVAVGPIKEDPTPTIFLPPRDKLARPSVSLEFPEVCGLIEAVISRTWRSHPTPDALQLHLVNALCPDAIYSYQDLLEEPFSILRCDPRVWRHGPLLKLLLALLTTFRRVSSMHLRQLNTEDALHPTAVDVGQYILVQDAILVHALLNVVARLNAEEAYPQCRHIYRWLDTAFRQAPSVLLAVHAQGYAKGLIGLLVAAVPSMVDLVPSLPDLLSCNDLAKLSFRCHVASALCRQYREAVPIAVLKTVVAKVKLVYDTDRSQTTDKLLSTDVLAFLIDVLPALGAMAVAFCDIAEECVQLLMKLRAQVNHQIADTLSNNAAVTKLETTVHQVFAQIIRSTEE